MLDANLRQQLQTYLERLTQPVELVASLDESDASTEMRGLLEDIVSLSPLLSLEERNEADVRKPSFTVGPRGTGARIRFAGVPMGHEFTSLVLALLQAGGYPPKVDAAVIEQIKSLNTRLDFEIYISLSCHNCPDVVQALNLMAVLNPNVTSTMIDGAVFQQEVEARQVLAVPMVFLNGQVFGQGRMSIEEILAKVDTNADARQAEQINAKGAFDVLIVVGGPAGAAAAISFCRKNRSVPSFCAGRAALSAWAMTLRSSTAAASALLLLTSSSRTVPGPFAGVRKSARFQPPGWRLFAFRTISCSLMTLP